MALETLISDISTNNGVVGSSGVLPNKSEFGYEASELELLTQRRQTEEKRKALYHWSLLRDSIKNVRQAVEHADAKDSTISHGIYHDRKINHTSTILHAIYIPQKREYLTTDGELFQVFYSDGRKKEAIVLEEPMNRVVYASQTNQYVGWVHKKSTLYLMSDSFEIKSQSQAKGGIYLADFNTCTGEVVTVGPGFIMSWAFRYNARHLIPRSCVNTEFLEHNIFSIMVLEDTTRQRQQVFFACGNGVVVYSVFEGQLLVHRKDLHVRIITAMTFFNPLKYLVTGAQDGCIKVWDSNWQVVMVFVGHSQAINALAIYPHGPSFMSASLDCTIRVWSLETCDEVDKTSMTEPAEGLFTSMNYDVFFTFAGKKMDLWRLQHLYYIHTNIGHRVNSIKLTTHLAFPARAVLLCRDSSVRIVSPPSGEVLTTLLMPPYAGLVDAAYAIAEDTMFAILGNGDIVKCRTDVNPCKVVARWKCKSSQEMCTCLLVYEYVVDLVETTVWSRKAGDTTARSGKKSESRNRTLLLGGRKDGCICMYNWYTGDACFKVDAHGNKGVLKMIANSKLDQLISAGNDNIIKVWRIFAFAEEALAPMMSFYCAHTPAHLSTIKSTLCVAFQDPATATFSIVLYNLPDKDRRDHKPGDDHKDLVTGLTSCARMKLFASSSMDGTVRVWNEENVLLRTLRLNAMPNCVAFCSSRGDLLVGIGQHLFHFPWNKYLPKPYLRRMVSMRFLEPRSEEPIPFDMNVLNGMEKDDVKRLKASHAAFKILHLEDDLLTDENDNVVLDKKIKEQAFKALEMRENELALIREGAKGPARKPKASKRTRREALQNYWKIFYNKERIQAPLEDPYPLDTLNARLQPQKEAEVDDVYRPETTPASFFQETDRTRSAGTRQGPVFGGFVPNSVLVKVLYPPPPPPPDPATSRPYRPPVLTAKQLSEIRALRRPGDDSYSTGRSVTFADKEESFDLSARVIEFDLDDDDDDDRADTAKDEKELSGLSMTSEKSGAESQREATSASQPSAPASGSEAGRIASASTAPATTPASAQSAHVSAQRRKKKVVIKEDEEDDEDDDELRGRPSARGQSNLMAKFKDIMAKPPSPKEPEVSEVKEAPEAKPSPAQREPVQPARPIKKLVSRPRSKVPTPPPAKSPTPPPPPTPLPGFISQFVGAEWFEKYFPNCNETSLSELGTMPKPWTGDTLVNMIIKLLRFASFPHKTSVAEGLVLVHAQEPLSESTCLAAHRMLLTALNHHAHTPAPAVPEEKNFILAALRALRALGTCDKEFVVEMLAQFLDGDQEIRAVVMDILRTIGCHDPHRQLEKELDSWDSWTLDEADRKKGLIRLCSQWLDRWMTSYRLHIKDTVERLQKGQNVHGRMSRGALTSRGSGADTARRGSSFQDAETVTRHGGSGDLSSRSPTRTSITITIDRPDMAAAESATYLEALNYFCEIMMEREREALRRGEVLRRGLEQEPVAQAKNTVLVLPKIVQKPTLVRLGETHTSKCRPTRETVFSVNYTQMALLGKGRQPPPGSLTGFVPCINLPMKTVYLNPFPSPADALCLRLSEPILITLRSSQKYFLPAQSVVLEEGEASRSAA